MKPDICIYHHPCTDGFTAAWACYHRYGNEVEYIPVDHGNPLLDDHWLEICKDKHVVVLDFSFNRNLTEKLIVAAKSLEIIDHHVSAQDNLKGLSCCTFDTNKSGAALAWERFHSKEIPAFVAYVQDQDLRKWELPNSKQLAAFLDTQPRDFNTWDGMYYCFEGEALGMFQMAGNYMNDYREKIIDVIIEQRQLWTLGYYDVQAVNCPHPLRAAVCEVDTESGPIAAYSIEGDKVVWSLRSSNGTAVEIAKQFEGGGGHDNSAGFAVPIEAMNFRTRELWPPGKTSSEEEKPSNVELDTIRNSIAIEELTETVKDLKEQIERLQKEVSLQNTSKLLH